jgi:hypothetical protein
MQSHRNTKQPAEHRKRYQQHTEEDCRE